MAFAGWVPAAALVGGLYFALAGIQHAMKGDRNGKETLAMVSDLYMAVVLLGYLIGLAATA